MTASARFTGMSASRLHNVVQLYLDGLYKCKPAMYIFTQSSLFELQLLGGRAAEIKIVPKEVVLLHIRERLPAAGATVERGG